MSKKFTPPVFGKFAKNVKDLFKKKYDFDHTVKVVNKAQGGITLESGAVTADGTDLKGYIKGKYAVAEWGEAEVEVWTAASKESKATVKFTKLADGVTATLGATAADKDFKGPAASVDVEYSQEYLSIQEVIKTELNSAKVETSVAVGSDGVSLGAQVAADVSAKGVVLKDFNFAAEYTQNDLTASLYTEKNASVYNVGLYQKPAKGQVVGAVLKYDQPTAARSLTLGGEYALGFDSTVRGKAELPSGIVSLSVENRLVNPSLLFTVAAQFGTKPTLSSQKLGITAALGDY